MNHQKKRIFFIRDNDSENSSDNDQKVEENTEDHVTDTVARKAMVNTIGFYKSYISPLLPPACRFTPTCSQYGIQAIEEYGPQKGLILIAWRLLRCSPIGGRGYDPPKWPPVSYTYSSY
jgi:putative membrane protein insertion efficiency factor